MDYGLSQVEVVGRIPQGQSGQIGRATEPQQTEPLHQSVSQYAKRIVELVGATQRILDRLHGSMPQAPSDNSKVEREPSTMQFVAGISQALYALESNIMRISDTIG